MSTDREKEIRSAFERFGLEARDDRPLDLEQTHVPDHSDQQFTLASAPPEKGGTGQLTNTTTVKGRDGKLE